MNRQATELEAVLRAAIVSSATFAVERGISFELDASERGMLVSAATRIKQLVTQLVSNAAKHSSQGSTVTVRAAVLGSKIRVEIRDSGTAFCLELPLAQPHIVDAGALGMAA